MKEKNLTRIAGYDGQVFERDTTLRSVIGLSRSASDERPPADAVMANMGLGILDEPQNVFRAAWVSRQIAAEHAREKLLSETVQEVEDEAEREVLRRISAVMLGFYAIVAAKYTATRLLVFEPPETSGDWKSALAAVAMLADCVAMVHSKYPNAPTAAVAIQNSEPWATTCGLVTPRDICDFFRAMDEVCPEVRTTLDLSLAYNVSRVAWTDLSPAEFLDQLDDKVPVGTVMLGDANDPRTAQEVKARPLGRGVIGKEGIRELWRYMREHHRRFRGIPVFNLDARRALQGVLVDSTPVQHIVQECLTEAAKSNPFHNCSKVVRWTRETRPGQHN